MKINILILLLLFLNYIDINKGFTFTDVTINSTPIKYSNPDGSCNFNFNILCEPNSQELCSAISAIETKGIYTPTVTQVVNNGTSYIYGISFTTNYGQYSILINSVYVINTECKILGIAAIQLKPTSNYYSVLYDGSNFRNQIVFEAVGTNSTVPLDSSCFTFLNNQAGCKITKYEYSNNKFLLYCIQLPTTFDLNLVQINLTSNSRSVLLNLDTSSYEKDYYRVYDIKTYPDSTSLQNLALFGYNENPILSFKMNSTIEKNVFYIRGSSHLYSIVYPTYSDSTSSTYYLPLNEYTQDAAYDLYYLSGSKITKLSNSDQIKTTINQYQLNQLPVSYSKSYINDMPLFQVIFTNNRQTSYSPINILINYGSEDCRISTNYPFGYTLINSTSYIFDFNSMLKSSFFTPTTTRISFVLPDLSITTVNVPPPSNTITYLTSLSPKIIEFKVFNLEYDLNLYRINTSVPYGFNYIKSLNRKIGSESLVYGNSTIAILEFIRTSDEIKIFDKYQGYSTYTSESFIPQNQKFDLFASPTYKFNNLDDISQISFLYNNIDVTNRRYYNVFYFNFTDERVPRNSVFRLVPNLYFSTTSFDYVISDSVLSFPSVWNQTLKLFQIEFYVEANSPLGEWPFLLVFNNAVKTYSQSLNTQLIIKKTNFDNQGPIFKEIIFQMSKYGNSNIFGWTFVIEDLINGFESGYITIKNDYDQSIYNYTIGIKDMKSGNRYLGSYDILLNISNPCISSNYSISEVKLFDSMKRLSYYSKFKATLNTSVLNPFINFLNDTSIHEILLTCAIAIVADTTPPELTQFTPSVTEIDVSKTSRNVSFIFIASDIESYMKENQCPIVYLSDTNNRILECKSNTTSGLASISQFSCSIELPLSFGYPGDITLSIFGLVNNAGLVSGYSTRNLIQNNFQWKILTKFDTAEPVLTGNNQITEKSTNLWIYGRGLENSVKVYIQNSDSILNTLIPTKIYSSAVQISGLKSTNKPFQVYVETSNNYLSNILTITPLVYNYYLDVCNGNGIPNQLDGYCICNSKWTTLELSRQCMAINHYISSSSQISSLTGGEIYLYGYFGNTYNNQTLYINNQLTTIISTTSNSIKTIIGPGKIGSVEISYSQNDLTWNGLVYPYSTIELLCPSGCEQHGICNKTTGKCNCLDGYTGIDCTSPTNNNNNNNNNNNSTTEVNNNGETVIKNQDIGYSISIDSISELDLNNNIVSTFNLSNNWIYINKTESITTFNQIRNNQDETKSLISLMIEEVNDQDKEFKFAGNQFTVTKGGFKLSLLISNWQYFSNLNTLQIQMSSDIQINQNSNDCNHNNNNAVIESSSNNNYLLNNINYLKVTKNNRSFYARFQDKMLANERPATVLAQLLNSSSNSNNIKILLNLPRCDECLIDPDFSLLTTSDYVFDCKNTNKKWVIAVVVSIVGFVILLLSIFTIYKKSSFLKIKVYTIKKKLKIIN